VRIGLKIEKFHYRWAKLKSGRRAMVEDCAQSPFPVPEEEHQLMEAFEVRLPVAVL
jgi:hypothetical protein